MYGCVELCPIPRSQRLRNPLAFSHVSSVNKLLVGANEVQCSPRTAADSAHREFRCIWHTEVVNVRRVVHKLGCTASQQ